MVADGHILSHRVWLITSHPAVGDWQPVTWDTTIIHGVHRSTWVVNAEAVQKAEGLKNHSLPADWLHFLSYGGVYVGGAGRGYYALA